MSLRKLPLLPPDAQALVDSSGRLTMAWREYLQQLDIIVRLVNGTIGLGAGTAAQLPAAAVAGAGARAFVTDASATTFNSTVAGGGSNKVPVVSDGTNWKIG